MRGHPVVGLASPVTVLSLITLKYSLLFPCLSHCIATPLYLSHYFPHAINISRDNNFPSPIHFSLCRAGEGVVYLLTSIHYATTSQAKREQLHYILPLRFNRNKHTYAPSDNPAHLLGLCLRGECARLVQLIKPVYIRKHLRTEKRESSLARRPGHLTGVPVGLYETI